MSEVAGSDHFPALDGLRAVAILLVLPHNLNVLSDPLPGAAYLWVKLVQFGWTGVQLFFVLSGFLITRGLLESRQASNYYSAFFGRRVLRIFPLYYATLFVILIIWPIIFPASPPAAAPFRHEIWYWTFLANWSSPLGGDIKGISHFWSLAVEEQFYLLWPFIIHRRTDRELLRICGALILIAFSVRLLFVISGASPEYSYSFTVCRMDALASGAIIAILFRDPARHEWLRSHQSSLLIVAAGVLIAGELTTHGFYREGAATITWGHLALDGSFACFVAAAAIGSFGAARMWSRALSNAPMRAIGKYSYGMYVIHYPINRYVTRPWMESLHPSRAAGIVYVLLAMVATFVLAFISYHLLEKHFLRLKNHFQPALPRAP